MATYRVRVVKPLSFSLLALLLGCQNEPAPAAKKGGIVEPTGASVLLQVVDPNGNPVSSAAVTPAGTAVPIATDGAGYILLDKLDIGRFSARVEKPGFAPAVAVIDVPTPDIHTSAKVHLMNLPPPFTFDSAIGTAMDQGNVHVTIPSNALIDQHGDPVVGMVSATILPIDPTAEGQTLPGPMLGQSSGGNVTLLESLGMVEVTISQNGLPVQLAPGKTATIEFVLPDALAQTAHLGDVVPAWWLDLGSGVWRGDGTSIIQSSLAEPSKLAWTSTVGHFTWWNAGPDGEAQCFRVKLVDPSGAPSSGEGIDVVGGAYASSTSDGSGIACVDSAAGETVEIFARAGAMPASMHIAVSGPNNRCDMNRNACPMVASAIVTPKMTPTENPEGSSQECIYEGPPGTQNVGLCKAGKKYLLADGWTDCIGNEAPKPENCATPFDDDCDGGTNEGCPGQSALTCGSHEDMYKIPEVTDWLEMSGTEVGFKLGINRNFGGVGVELDLINLDCPDQRINVLEGRSAAGAGLQVGQPAQTLDGISVLTNQAAGNAANYQWGFSQNVISGGDSAGRYLKATNWAPLYRDTFDGQWRTPCPTAPGTSVALDEGKFEMEAHPEPIIGHGNAIAFNDYYFARSTTEQAWARSTFWSAFYMNRKVGREHDMRLYIKGKSGSRLGPIYMADKWTAIQLDDPNFPGHEGEMIPPTWPGTWSDLKEPESIAMVWNIYGRDIGIGIRNLPSVGSIRLAESGIYCENSSDDTCGSMDVLVNQPNKTGDAAQFHVGDIRDAKFEYLIGTAAQLAAAGFFVQDLACPSGEPCPPSSCSATLCTQGETQPCGFCGTRLRECLPDGTFGPWSACTSMGVCMPPMTKTCGDGTVIGCDSNCQWLGPCPPPPPTECKLDVRSWAGGYEQREDIAAYGKAYAYDTYGIPLPGFTNPTDLLSIPLFANGPCAGHAPGTCKLDTYAWAVAPPSLERVDITAYGRGYSYYSDNTPIAGFTDAGIDLTQLPPFSSGPCAGKAFGSCKLDTYASNSNNGNIEISAYGKAWWYSSDFMNTLRDGVDLVTVAPAFANGPCNGKAPGTCEFDTYTWHKVGGLDRLEITAYGKIWYFDKDFLPWTDGVINGQNLLDIPQFADGPCKP